MRDGIRGVLSSGWFEFSNTAVRSPTLRVLFGLAIAASVETDWHLPGVLVFTEHVFGILVFTGHVFGMFGDTVLEVFVFVDPCPLGLGLVALGVVLPAMVSAVNEAHSLVFVVFGVPALVSTEKAAHSLVMVSFGVSALVLAEKEAVSLRKVVVALGVPGMVSAKTARLFVWSPFSPSSVGGTLVGTSRGEEADISAVVCSAVSVLSCSVLLVPRVCSAGLIERESLFEAGFEAIIVGSFLAASFGACLFDLSFPFGSSVARVPTVAEMTIGLLLLFILPPLEGMLGKDCTRDAADVSNLDLEIRLGVRTESLDAHSSRANISEGWVADGN
mmetsp:Transcript_58116/g.69940  ORF Transcript_58116/g.69940 Transcript_58116/m.69940 type:complete len:331 (-) Transcript_58116:1847-2839(-)